MHMMKVNFMKNKMKDFRSIEEALQYLYDNEIISMTNYADLMEDLDDYEYYKNHFYDEDDEDDLYDEFAHEDL